MRNMFIHCTHLDSLDLTHLDITSVTTLEGIFNDCESIVHFDLGTWDTSNVESTEVMFGNCTTLECITGIDTTGTTGINERKNMGRR